MGLEKAEILEVMKISCESDVNEKPDKDLTEVCEVAQSFACI